MWVILTIVVAAALVIAFTGRKPVPVLEKLPVPNSPESDQAKQILDG